MSADKAVYERLKCIQGLLEQPKYDYEKLVLCDDLGNKILVESYTDISDPTQTRTTRYTDLATGAPYAGAVADLTNCGGEQIDIQTQQYCDGGETIFGTLVFDASVGTGTPTLLGIVFNKVDGSVHTPVAPVEGACELVVPDRVVQVPTDCDGTLVDVDVQDKSPVEVVLHPEQVVKVIMENCCTLIGPVGSITDRSVL